MKTELMIVAVVVASLAWTASAQTQAKPQPAKTQLFGWMGGLGLDPAEVPGASEPPAEPAEQAPAQNDGPQAKPQPIAFAGAGLVVGAGTWQQWTPGEGARGTVIVKGLITVTGPGVSGKANVTGAIPLEMYSGYLEGEGTVNGTVTLKDASGRTVGTPTAVSGPVKLRATMTTVKVPFINATRYLVHAEGTASVSGVLQP